MTIRTVAAEPESRLRTARPVRPARAAGASLFEQSAPRWRERGAAGVEPLGFVGLYRAEPLERIEWARRGVMARDVAAVGQRMGLSQERLYALLGLSRSTVDRKVREDRPLSRDEGERLIGLARLIGQIEVIVAESGEPAGFDAPSWLAGWLAQPLPALGGRAPGELIDTAEGQALVAEMLGRIQSGAYA